jgi:N-ethylmaleimide reductase
MKTEKPLLESYRLGDLTLRNRIVMAPLTRTRAANPGKIPTDLMVEYYKQRASAGLMISEGTFVSRRGQGWHGAPGLYNEDQAIAWKKITDAVHAEGGRIFLQLWHQGAVSMSEFFKPGERPLAPSSVNPKQLVHTANGRVMSETPDEMTLSDIRQTIADYRSSAKLAKDAGFDGVQLQAGYVYLIQQFLHETTNLRTDQYGGSIENRARLLFEILEAILEIWPSQRVGIKTGPMMNELGAFKAVASTLPTTEYVYQKLSGYHLSHLFVMRQNADLSQTPIAGLAGDEIARHVRQHYDGQIILNVGIDTDHGNQLLKDGLADLVAFGREYIANPDLVERIRIGAPLNPQRPEFFYGATAAGYTDYPFLERTTGK